MNDSFTTTTTTGYFSRLGKSIAGILLGPIIIFLSVVLLWWNEGRSVHTATALNEGEKEVVTVSADSVNPSNDRKLVYTTGLATTEEELTDSKFNISKNALILHRKTEIYVWKENERSETKKNLGGSETTTKTYTYEKVWSDKLIDSSKFEHRDGHNNPNSMRVPTEKFVGKHVTLGAFKIDPDLVNKIDGEEQLIIRKSDLDNVEDFDDITTYNDAFYLGKNPSNPQIGDIIVRYFYIEPKDVSIVAAQVGKTLNTYTAKNGTPIALVQSGIQTAAALFEAARNENAMITWLVRILGLVLCMAGFALILKPLSVLGDVVPFIGTVIGYGTGFVAGILGFLVSSITIAIAWIFYRPVLGISLLIGTIAITVYLYRRKKNKINSAPPVAPQAPGYSLRTSDQS